jgi:regulator of cell morphogenesis and NO signaling
MNTLEKTTIGEFVAQDFRTAAVLSKYGIDFCCKGGRTLEEVCNKKELDMNTIEKEINSVLETKNDNGIDFKSWPADLLVDYIQKVHHEYVLEKSPVILTFLEKLCNVHGGNHPELFEINTLFKIGVGALSSHMKKEELVLFPFIKEMQNALNTNVAIEQPHFGTVENPIAVMMDDHDNEGERFRRIAELTNNFTPPADACNTYKVAFAMLQDFEADLHKHIHLENNILFHKATELEQRFTVS